MLVALRIPAQAKPKGTRRLTWRAFRSTALPEVARLKQVDVLRMIKMVAGKKATTSRRPSQISSMPEIPPLKPAGAGGAVQKDGDGGTAGGAGSGGGGGSGDVQPRRRLSFMAPTKSSRNQRRDA